jgi:hypothetical protein
MTTNHEALSGGGWRSIETAPDEGRILVVGGRYESPELLVADGSWWRRQKWNRSTPTHWQPLPPLPHPQTGGGDE